MNFKTDQIDLICTISVILKKTPYTYTEISALWYSEEGIIVLDFDNREMQFTDWKHTQDEIYFQLLGVCHMFSLKSEDYMTK